MLFIYYIDREELYALKKSLLNESEIEKLRDWEIENKEYLIIEFINDKKLFDINELQLTFSEKITIFIEIIITFEYLHRNQFIYLDLKTSKAMINKSKTII